MSECVICRIASGEDRSEIIYEDDHVIGLMDIRPIRPGACADHPSRALRLFRRSPDATASRIIHLGQRLSRAMKALYGVMKALYGVPRVAFLFTGGDHAHAHAHVVPLHEKTDITSRRYIAEKTVTFRDVPLAPSEELAATAGQLRSGLRR
jgi:histidine triad (HIT) family protein